MKATSNFAKKLDPDWCQFNIFIAYPSSIIYKEILEKGLYDRVEDFVVYVKTEDFDYDSLLKVQRRFHRSFNRSPKRILRKIRREGTRAFGVLRNSLRLSRTHFDKRYPQLGFPRVYLPYHTKHQQIVGLHGVIDEKHLKSSYLGINYI